MRKAMEEFSIPREAIFVTTKLWFELSIRICSVFRVTVVQGSSGRREGVPRQLEGIECRVH